MVKPVAQLFYKTKSLSSTNKYPSTNSTIKATLCSDIECKYPIGSITFLTNLLDNKPTKSINATLILDDNQNAMNYIYLRDYTTKEKEGTILRKEGIFVFINKIIRSYIDDDIRCLSFY
jgi:hypothetical protein